MNTAVLRGRDHVEVGGVAAVAEGAAAIALSRGGARKQYRHTDPNEDAAGFAEGASGLLLAVADGHSGHEASEIAVQQLVERCAPDWTGAAGAELGGRWNEVARVALFDACHAIHLKAATGGRGTSRTTVAFVLVRPQEDLLVWASIGDSHVFLVEDEGAVELTSHKRGETWFLGHPSETRESIPDKCTAGRRSLAGVRAVALVTDGLSERGIGVERPVDAVTEAACRAASRVGDARDRLPLELARGIVETALDAHRRHDAGDNVAASVAWLDSL